MVQKMMSKAELHKNLLKWRTFVLCTPLLFLIMTVILLTIGVNEKTASLVSVMSAFVCCIFSFFVTFSKNYCPWCKEPFFEMSTMGLASPLALFRNKCCNCGEPKHSDDLPSK
jgi:hypothetical protein